MHTDWLNFLAAQDAHLDADGALRFADEDLTALHDAVKCPLTHFALLRVSGADAEGFLQNLFSNDIREVSASRAQLSSFNTPKGRMLASLLIWRDGEDYLLQLPRSLAETLRKKLSMYILRSKVKISDASTEWLLIGVSGGEEVLAARYGQLPDSDLGMLNKPDVRLLRCSPQRWQLAVRAEQAADVWQALPHRAMGTAGWDWLTIQAGIPVILPATQEAFVPQMVNFEQIGGINFKKGCYPGQEIVARMQYLGQAKRRMYRAHLDCAAQPGDELHSAALPGQASGHVVNAAPAPQGGYDLLVVLPISTVTQQVSVHHLKDQGPTLHLS